MHTVVQRFASNKLLYSALFVLTCYAVLRIIAVFVHKPALLKNYYKADNLFLPFNEIDALIESGAIYNARRPQNVYIGGWIVIHEHEIMDEE